jgi:hypothetical protein
MNLLMLIKVELLKPNPTQHLHGWQWAEPLGAIVIDGG